MVRITIQFIQLVRSERELEQKWQEKMFVYVCMWVSLFEPFGLVLVVPAKHRAGEMPGEY